MTSITSSRMAIPPPCARAAWIYVAPRKGHISLQRTLVADDWIAVLSYAEQATIFPDHNRLPWDALLPKAQESFKQWSIGFYATLGLVSGRKLSVAGELIRDVCGGTSRPPSLPSHRRNPDEDFVMKIGSALGQATRLPLSLAAEFGREKLAAGSTYGLHSVKLFADIAVEFTIDLDCKKDAERVDRLFDVLYPKASLMLQQDYSAISKA